MEHLVPSKNWAHLQLEAEREGQIEVKKSQENCPQHHSAINPMKGGRKMGHSVSAQAVLACMPGQSRVSVNDASVVSIQLSVY